MTTKSTALPVRYPRRQPVHIVLGTGFRDIWTHRRLAWYIVRADLKKHGADTILGNVWWILDPLLQLVVFAAILPWKWFSTSVNDAVTSVVSRERIIKQVKFPKIVLPFASTVGGIVNFVFGLIPLLALLVLFYSSHISWTLVLIPLIAVVQFAFTLGIAIALGALNVFYRDIGNLAKHVLRMWFYLSPALYTADRVAELTKNHPAIGTLFMLNPWTVLFGAYHDVIYYGRPPDWLGLAVVLLFSFILLGFTVLFFKRVEPAFAKVL